jgi:hypothetical protein
VSSFPGPCALEGPTAFVEKKGATERGLRDPLPSLLGQGEAGLKASDLCTLGGDREQKQAAHKEGRECTSP